MRWSSLIAVSLVCASCGPSGPVYRGLRVDLAVRAPVRVAVETKNTKPPPAEVEGQAGVEVGVEAGVEVEPPPPPPPPVAVALEGAPVVEFFGVPLEGAQDIVFVLDRSGSMSQPARGRIARMTTLAPPAPDPTAPPADGAMPGEPPPADPYQPPEPPPETPEQSGEQPPADPYQPEGQPLDASGDPSTPPPVAPPPLAPPVPRKIDVAQAELIDALERLPAGTRLNVVFFNYALEASSPGIVPLEEASRDELIQFVRETTPSGRTALAPAMRAAFLMNARRIVLLSDGLGNLGGDARAVIRDAREAMRGGVRIDTIGLGGNQDARLLRILANESGGLYQPL